MILGLVKQWICNSFQERGAAGSPAATVLLEEWVQSERLQSLAKRNDLPETTYLMALSPNTYQIRWFTPSCEAYFAGHATLAAAYTVFMLGLVQEGTVLFTCEKGDIKVTQRGDRLSMPFFKEPIGVPVTTLEIPAALRLVIPTHCLELFLGRDVVCILPSQRDVETYVPDFLVLSNIPARGLCITAPGSDTDYVSRFFCPKYGVPEDPVTGTSHAVIARYWSQRLGKNVVVGRQCSALGGIVHCRVCPEWTEIEGRVTFSQVSHAIL